MLIKINKKLAYFLIIILLILGCRSGPANLDQEKTQVEQIQDTNNPRALFSYYDQKAQETQEYKIRYLTKLEGSNESVLRILSKKGVKSKNSFGDSLLEYNINGARFQCNKYHDPKNQNNPEPYNCRILEDEKSNYTLFSIFPHINLSDENIDFSYSGKGSILGRDCDKLLVKVKDFAKFMDPKSIINKGGQNKIQINYEYCFDKKTGMMLSGKSELKGNIKESLFGNLPTSMKTEASYFSENVDDSEFVLSVDYVILDYACNNKDLVFTLQFSNDYDGEIIVKETDGDINPKEMEQLEQGQGDERVFSFMKVPKMSYKKDRVSVIKLERAKISEKNNRFFLCLSNKCEEIRSGARLPLFCASRFWESTKCIKLSNDENLCKGTDGCIFKDSSCMNFNCKFIKDINECNANTECTFYRAFESYPYGWCMEKSCGDLKSEAECNSFLPSNYFSMKCKWNQRDGRCTEKSCGDLKSEAECNSFLPKCKWNQDGQFGAWCMIAR